MRLIKFKRNNFIYAEYGIVEGDTVKPIKNNYTVSELFRSISTGTISTEGEIELNQISPLPPTDDTASIYCAGLNYLDHAIETKMPVPESPIFFSKSIATAAGAHDNIIYPESTKLLDYEIELALIVGRPIGIEDSITRENISRYILGITILNDISARDQQLIPGQWFLGKNYRTFAPMGPFIQVMDDKVAQKLDDLTLKLQVFDSDFQPYENKRQKGNTGNMIFKPHELLNTLGERFNLKAGDVIATGTPCNVALSSPSPVKARIAEILGLSQKKRLEIFIKGEIKNNRNYLTDEDCIVSRIYSEDGTVDLGEQKNKIVK